MKAIARVGAGVVVGGLIAASASGLALPCVSTFDSDTIGAMPVMGLAHSPTGVLKHFGTEADPMVVASTLGLVTQPVQFVVDPDPVAAALLVYDFDPNVTTVLRAEATVSVSDYANLIVMRTWMNSTGLVAGDIRFTDEGEIWGVGGQLGAYTPGVPVRIRMDVNILSGRYAAAVDDELNGFADDARVDGLSFMNDPSLVTNVGGFGVGYIRLGEGPTQMAVGADDILIMEIPSPGALGLAAIAAAVVWRRRR